MSQLLVDELVVCGEEHWGLGEYRNQGMQGLTRCFRVLILSMTLVLRKSKNSSNSILRLRRCLLFVCSIGGVKGEKAYPS